LQVDALGSLGVLAVALAALRIAGVRLGTMIGLRQAGLAQHPTNMLWMGLISQAGVTLGLTVIVASEFAGWGVRIQTLMVALIAIHEVVGPILFRAALARAGEVGQR
jgi:hypothetical protein